MDTDRIWYRRSLWTAVLLPLSWFFRSVAMLRRTAYRRRVLKSTRLEVPVIVVGNLTVGGTGKTPLVIWLSEFLQQSGYRPGIISRGYRGEARHWPQQVRPDSDPVSVGDEAVVIARRTGCPMAVGPDRIAAGEALLQHHDCDVIVSDDGLQHYRLQRDVEIVVIDGVRRFGNGECLPAGPLREPVGRLQQADLVVTTGMATHGEYAMAYAGKDLRNLLDESQVQPAAAFSGEQVHAVAGIGNPAQFFDKLRGLGLEVIEHPFADHHPFCKNDILFGDDLPVVMTEKDAVKCRRFAEAHFWYLPIEVKIQKQFGIRLLNLLESKHGQKAA